MTQKDPEGPRRTQKDPEGPKSPEASFSSWLLFREFEFNQRKDRGSTFGHWVIVYLYYLPTNSIGIQYSNGKKLNQM